MAAIVVDAKSGRVMYEAGADSLRYPASLTKMMTLYLTFEALSQGRIAKTTPVRFSPLAASMPPTKLGVPAGKAITVETAIYSLVTKSANDSAAALGELLGGSVPNFARMMTAKAHALGMSNTQFRNANGLPDPDQHTTARDMAVLGLALRAHFPQYFGYFSTRSFTYGNRRIANHNHLLGRVAGVDGIKTGYTRASGYNIVTSASLNGRRIVAVVMGGATSRIRDAQVTALIRKYLPGASEGPVMTEVVAEREEKAASKLKVVAAALPTQNAPVPGRKSRAARRAAAQALAAAQAAAQQEDQGDEDEADGQPQSDAASGQSAQLTALAETAKKPAVKQLDSEVDPVATGSTEKKGVKAIKADTAKGDSKAQNSGWVIQVASAPSEAQARALLDKTAEKAPRALADASPFTVAFEKNGATYYRARYGGFASKDEAWDACGALKKKKIACYAVAQ